MGFVASLANQMPARAVNYDSDGLVVANDIGRQKPMNEKNISVNTFETILYSVILLAIGAGVGYLLSGSSKSIKKSRKK